MSLRLVMLLICLSWGIATACWAKGETASRVFVLSWSPHYCNANQKKTNNNLRQCYEARKYGFVAHGIWNVKHNYCADTKTKVSDATLDSIKDIMPTKSLVLHEWRKHGACQETDPNVFFGRMSKLFRSITFPARLQRPSREIVTSRAELNQELISANPTWPANAFYLRCTGNYFRELRVCLDLNDRVVPCEPNVRATCPATGIRIRPVP